MKQMRKPHICPNCKGTGEEVVEWYGGVDDVTQVMSPNKLTVCNPEAYGDDRDDCDCHVCGGEGVVYDKFTFNDNTNYNLDEQKDFVTDDLLLSWCLA